MRFLSFSILFYYTLPSHPIIYLISSHSNQCNSFVGNKILENQLCLMDEKHADMRSKLDFCRDLGAKRVLKADKIARDLRLKLAQMGVRDYTPDRMGSALPDIFTPTSTPGTALLNIIIFDFYYELLLCVGYLLWCVVLIAFDCGMIFYAPLRYDTFPI
jgi:hypothetical protein